MKAEQFQLPAWYVVFTPGAKRWWDRFLEPGFGHVYAFGWDEPAGVWVVFMFGWDGVAVRAMPHGWFPGFLDAMRAERSTVVLARTVGRVAFRPRILTTCVGAVSMLLGYAPRRALTPFALYRTLMADGAVLVMEN